MRGTKVQHTPYARTVYLAASQLRPQSHHQMLHSTTTSHYNYLYYSPCLARRAVVQLPSPIGYRGILGIQVIFKLAHSATALSSLFSSLSSPPYYQLSMEQLSCHPRQDKLHEQLDNSHKAGLAGC